MNLGHKSGKEKEGFWINAMRKKGPPAPSKIQGVLCQSTSKIMKIFKATWKSFNLSEKFGRPDSCQQFPLDLLLRQTLVSKLTHLLAEPVEDSLPEN